jgi:8-oxo-dGTP pyrophosphatase MutT (NUDIX family)
MREIAKGRVKITNEDVNTLFGGQRQPNILRDIEMGEFDPTDGFTGWTNIDGKSIKLSSGDGLDWEIVSADEKPAEEIDANLPFGEIVASRQVTLHNCYLRVPTGWRRIVIIGRKNGRDMFAATDEVLPELEEEIGLLYPAPTKGGVLGTPVQALGFPEGSRFRLPGGRRLVKSGDNFVYENKSYDHHSLDLETRLAEVILPKKREETILPKTKDSSDIIPAKKKEAKPEDGILVEDNDDVLVHKLKSIFYSADFSDSEICNGIKLNAKGLAKVSRKLGVDEAHTKLIFAKLKQSVRDELNESAEQFSFEKDLLGNINITDIKSGKEVLLRGSKAEELSSKLTNKPDEEQSILASYMALNEDEHDEREHAEALSKTGFWGKQGAGCIVIASSTGRILLNHRSAHVEQPGTWGCWGGAIDRGESPVDAVRREFKEEAGSDAAIDLIVPLYVFKKGDFTYRNYLVVIEDEFNPKMGWESQGFRWCEYGNWPSPLHFGLKALFSDSASTVKIEKFIEAQEVPKIEESFEEAQEITRGTYNFPWKVKNKIGLATASFSGGEGKMNVKVIDVRDNDGNEIDYKSFEDDIKQQAIDFIGKE